jgi:catechol 2,3-dioxygenase-like lactoylglutathione lyase family enzyme
MLTPNRILETCLYVDDMAAARRFYAEVLGLMVVEEQAGRHLFLRCGQQMLLLFIADACSMPGGMLPVHGARGPGHLAFAATDEELVTWREQLERSGIAIETSIDWPHGGRSLYFRDPAGNSLEFATPRMWRLS